MKMSLPDKEKVLSKGLKKLDEKYVELKEELEKEKNALLDDLSGKLEGEKKKLLEKLGYG